MQRPLLQVNKFGADISKSQLEHRDRFSARWELRIVPERSSAGESTSSWVEAGIWKEQVQWIPTFTIIYSPLRIFFFQLTVCWRCGSWNRPLSITERAVFIWYLDHDGLSNLQPWSWPWSTKAGLNCLSLTNRGTILYRDGASHQAWATVSRIASI